ncbi:hypothetical protein [Pseudomonas fluorescens]|uniref:hypothetical protein n=1 Tax=Pseudomonas fluorescens TaxID=294 RepID=UPI0013D401AA|nr:hypothetical protein [Pseudomonas fluorescens]
MIEVHFSGVSLPCPRRIEKVRVNAYAPLNALGPADLLGNALLNAGQFFEAWKFTLPRRISHKIDLK